jgi:hypothetical protein
MVDAWVRKMITTPFHDYTCTLHSQVPNSVFCTTCKIKLCKECSSEHCCSGGGTANYRRIYRYMLHDVARCNAISNDIDIDGIQVYYSNEHRVVHLRPRPVSQMLVVTPDATAECLGGCGRLLRPPWLYCSLACKMMMGTPCEKHARVFFRSRKPCFPERSKFS